MWQYKRSDAALPNLTFQQAKHFYATGICIKGAFC